MKKIVAILTLILISFSCDKQEVTINELLLNEIKEYIDLSESEAEKSEAYFETGLYLVKFYDLDDKEYLIILESNFYPMDDIDGYMAIGDNEVFFYNMPITFVDKKTLNKAKHSNSPSQDSILDEDGLDSVVWYYQVIDNNQIKKVDGKDFLIKW